MTEKEILKLMSGITFFKPFSLKEKKVMASIDTHIVEFKKGEHVIGKVPLSVEIEQCLTPL